MQTAERPASPAPPGGETGALRSGSRKLSGRAGRALRVCIGVLLLALTLLPVYRLLDHPDTGLAGSYTVNLLGIYYEFAWTGLLLLVPIALISGLLISESLLTRWGDTLQRMLLRPRAWIFCLGPAAIGAVFTAVFSLLVLEGKPSIIDAFAQMLHARYWAAGMLAGPGSEYFGEFWGIQNALFTERGWVSQYPPGHVALMVPFFWLGVPWLHGPVMVFITILFSGLLVERVFAEDRLVARLGTILLAFSPFFLFVGGSLMNHVTMAACVAFGGYALMRAWCESPRWVLAAGPAFALSLATRPYATLAMGAALLFSLLLLWPRPARRSLSVIGLALLGGAPILGGWFWHNQHFFGSPFRMGYSVTLGPSMSLGFHQDPWGNTYGLTEAVAYTSSDLTMLGVNLFETPLPALLVIAVFLLAARRVSRGVCLLLAWAMVPVLANAFYWHHGDYMGPRMLHEASPAWVLLFAAVVTELLRRIPGKDTTATSFSLRSAFAGVVIASFAIGLVYLTPIRAASYGGSWIEVARTPLPKTDEPAIVFVHDAWNARIAMTLASRGMRLDRVETIVRQNSTCRVHELAEAVAADDQPAVARLLAALDTVPRADSLPLAVELAPGDGMRIWPGDTLTPDCVRQARSDRFGILDIAPLLWQGDLPGLPGRGTLVVRDMGPEKNQVILRAHPDRRPFVYLPGPGGRGVQLLPYETGMQQLWGAPAG